MKVLLVEDERTLSRLIYEALVHQLFTVETAFDGEEALFRIHNYTYDAIILDILLPKRSGWEVLDEARKTGVQTPVLLLTALSQVEDRVRGLNTGADDYLAKPFDIRELVARVQALIRRSVKTRNEGGLLRCADLEVDTIKKTVRRGDRLIDLTKKEYQILEYLLYHRGEVVTKETLEERLWGDEESLWSDVIRSHMKNLRKKLDQKHRRSLIRTVRGEGYVCDCE
ncbi:MAG TPA: response regulator transcription factor [Thermotogota bacterium]|nr:response regulator transcription factor [Thermotogota bacterium]HNW45888.1 response regulator transcription factor [Thermotogota bacterium]HNY81544.1 response regulator transcription factor [Thermotogota bacterium]HOD90315.1 response regulator transcription factor [Thermotogota bacterium]HOF22474.1 response regulator transcription factor [Thermotogota bacterium]